MYKCNNCGNESEFEEQNVYKTYVKQINDSDISTCDEFFYREDVVCLECNYTLNDGIVVEDK